VDQKLFKQAVGSFASGVTVVTTRTAEGGDHGMTASAFSSLSLEPPLVLVCVQEKNQTHELLEAAGHFAVNILARDQEERSNRFAGGLVDADGNWQSWPAARDKFAGLDFNRGEACGGAALLAGCVAQLECRLEALLPGGDHGIFVGRVEAVHVAGGDPLLYAKGRYGGLA
tara:strand:+ start:1200 stop:1712 length:513 start_codon:yes stop_codon:yes gene_type:complete